MFLPQYNGIRYLKERGRRVWPSINPSITHSAPRIFHRLYGTKVMELIVAQDLIIALFHSGSAAVFSRTDGQYIGPVLDDSWQAVRSICYNKWNDTLFVIWHSAIYDEGLKIHIVARSELKSGNTVAFPSGKALRALTVSHPGFIEFEAEENAWIVTSTPQSQSFTLWDMRDYSLLFVIQYDDHQELRLSRDTIALFQLPGQDTLRVRLLSVRGGTEMADTMVGLHDNKELKLVELCGSMLLTKQDGCLLRAHNLISGNTTEAPDTENFNPQAVTFLPPKKVWDSRTDRARELTKFVALGQEMIELYVCNDTKVQKLLVVKLAGTPINESHTQVVHSPPLLLLHIRSRQPQDSMPHVMPAVLSEIMTRFDTASNFFAGRKGGASSLTQQHFPSLDPADAPATSFSQVQRTTSNPGGQRHRQRRGRACRPPPATRYRNALASLIPFVDLGQLAKPRIPTDEVFGQSPSKATDTPVDLTPPAGSGCSEAGTRTDKSSPGSFKEQEQGGSSLTTSSRADRSARSLNSSPLSKNRYLNLSSTACGLSRDRCLREYLKAVEQRSRSRQYSQTPQLRDLSIITGRGLKRATTDTGELCYEGGFSATWPCEALEGAAANRLRRRLAEREELRRDQEGVTVEPPGVLMFNLDEGEPMGIVELPIDFEQPNAIAFDPETHDFYVANDDKILWSGPGYLTVRNGNRRSLSTPSSRSGISEVGEELSSRSNTAPKID